MAPPPVLRYTHVQTCRWKKKRKRKYTQLVIVFGKLAVCGLFYFLFSCREACMKCKGICIDIILKLLK